MNCLAYALHFWKRNPKYRIFYDGCHVINSHYELHGPLILPGWYEPAENCGYEYFARVFADLLNQEEKELLKQYFNVN